jgi:hypothetical protein
MNGRTIFGTNRITPTLISQRLQVVAQRFGGSGALLRRNRLWVVRQDERLGGLDDDDSLLSLGGIISCGFET